MIYAFDTDIFSLLLRGHTRVAGRYSELVESTEHRFVLPAVVRIELLEGRFASIGKAPDGPAVLKAFSLLERTERAINEYSILPIDQRVADLYSGFRKDRKTRNSRVKDLQIACIALAHNATLVTRNTKDFAIVPGLKLENWAD